MACAILDEPTYKLRVATLDDSAAIQAIYAPYVMKMAVTFEVVPPSVAEIRHRMETTLARYPFLVAEGPDGVVGFSYVGHFRPRVAYDHSVETSIYVKEDIRAKGIGRLLYQGIFAILPLQRVYNVYACVAVADPEDEYVPATSTKFHEAMGFKTVAHFTKCGRKFNRWYDMTWMELFLVDEHPSDTQPFLPFPQLNSAEIEKLLAAL